MSNSDVIITVDRLSKRYQLGQIGATSLRESAERWWHRLRGRDPDRCMATIGSYGSNGVEESGSTAGSDPHTPLPPNSLTSSPPRDELWALRDVSFEVKRGEVLGIIGRNGAGKSTLLKILTRITEPTSGRAIMRGRVASLLEVGTGFHPELTGRENIFLNGAILGMKRAEIAAKFDEIVAFSEVEKFIDTPVKRYSSGMYVRLAFAVAAHLEPEILLVDEVLAVGDAEFQKKCLGKMDDVAKGGRTVLFVSHNMTAVENLCKRVVLLKDGAMSAIGDSDEVIGLYLSHSTAIAGPMDLRGVAARRGRGALRFSRLCLLDEQDNPCTAFAAGRCARFRVMFTRETDTPARGCRVSLGLRSVRGASIMLSSELIRSDALALGEGSIVEFVMPRLPLSHGTYQISLFVEASGTIEDWLEDVASLTVEGGDYYGLGRNCPYGLDGATVLTEFSFSDVQP